MHDQQTDTAAPATQTPGRTKALLAVAGLLACAAGVGALVVASVVSEPSRADGALARPPAEASRAVSVGLEAAAEYQRRGEYEKAAAILAKLAEEPGGATDQAVRLAWAQALLGQRKHAEAYQQYEAAIAISGAPRLTENGARRADPAAAQLNFEAGTCAFKAGMMDRAEEHYHTAQTADPSEPRYPLYLAMVQTRTGDDAAASASLLRAVKLNPDLAEAWGTLAELALKQNRLGLAAQHVAEARRLQPNTARWRVIEARVYNRQNEPEKAATLLLSLDPAQRRAPEILALLAESYGLLRRPADAAELYAEAFRAAADPKAQPEHAYQAALWYERAENAAKALEFARTAGMLGHEGGKELFARLSATRAS